MIRPSYLGGPVRGPLAALHTHVEHANLEVISGVYYTVEDKSLSDVIRQDRNSYHIYIGYSGWAPGQLESEIEADGWLTTAAEEGDVFRPPHLLWQELTRRIGSEFLRDTVKPNLSGLRGRGKGSQVAVASAPIMNSPRTGAAKRVNRRVSQ